MKRLSSAIAEAVRQAIDETMMLAADRDVLEWEVIPVVGMDRSVRWLVGIGLPVPATEDSMMPFAPLSDPHSQDEIKQLVRALYEAAVNQVAEAAAKISSSSNGHRESPGGLILP
jgi:hypothetical protein